MSLFSGNSSVLKIESAKCLYLHITRCHIPQDGNFIAKILITFNISNDIALLNTPVRE
jgi:hypothetical protein